MPVLSQSTVSKNQVTMPEKLITFVIGSACSGKSTLAGYLGRKNHGITFRASEYMQSYISEHHPGKTLRDFIGPDFLAHVPGVDDADLLCSGLINTVSSKNRVIVDGFPRNLHQMFTMEGRLTELTSHGHSVRVINLLVPIQELLRRMYARGRPGDTEHRIMAEVGVHENIARRFKDICDRRRTFNFIEFRVPVDVAHMKIKRDLTKTQSGKMTDIAFLDSISRRMNQIFAEIEYKRIEGFKRGSYTVYEG